MTSAIESYKNGLRLSLEMFEPVIAETNDPTDRHTPIALMFAISRLPLSPVVHYSFDVSQIRT